MRKYLISTIAIIFVLSLAVGSVVMSYNSNAKVVVEGDYIEAQNSVDEELGAISSPYIYTDVNVYGQLGYKVKYRSIAQTFTTGTSTVTLSADESGSTIFLSASSTRVVLPAVARGGTFFRFQVNGSMAGGGSIDGNYIIDSAEGDNMSGTLSVNNADVACSAEDQFNIVTDGETIGDYFELLSDGTQWLIVDSGVETAAKLTCTDPN